MASISSQVGPVAEPQVHEEEREVGGGVGVAEAVVELDAVDGERRPVRAEVDVVEVEVAVGVGVLEEVAVAVADAVAVDVNRPVGARRPDAASILPMVRNTGPTARA